MASESMGRRRFLARSLGAAVSAVTPLWPGGVSSSEALFRPRSAWAIVREWARGGRIGQVIWAQHNVPDRGTPNAVRKRLREGYNALREALEAGRPTRVIAGGRVSQYLVAHFASGLSIVILSGAVEGEELRTIIRGRKGTICIGQSITLDLGPHG